MRALFNVPTLEGTAVFFACYDARLAIRQYSRRGAQSFTFVLNIRLPVPPLLPCFRAQTKGSRHKGDGVPAAHAQPGRHGALLEASFAHQHLRIGKFVRAFLVVAVRG